MVRRGVVGKSKGKGDNLNIPGTAHLGVSRAWVGQMLRLPLFTNALYLLLANGIAPVLGLAFWVLAARFYSAEAVGFTSAAMAGVGTVMLFCHLGLGLGLVRFLAQAGDRGERVINTVYTVGILTALAGALVFLAGVHIWSEPLIALRQNGLYMAVFVLFAVAYNMGILVDDSFVASRRAGFVLVRSIVFNVLKLGLLVALAASLPGFGILASWTAAFWVSLLLLIVLLPRVQPGYRPRPLMDFRVLKEVVPFSLANQIGSVLLMAPSMLLPLLVINSLGAESTAYFSIAAAATSPLAMVSGAFSTSLFAEGSFDAAKLALNARRSLLVTFAVLAPAVVLALLLAPYVLLLFGRSYATEGVWLLRILAVAALPLAFNSIYVSIKRVKKELKTIVALTGLGAAATIGLTYALMPPLGANGAGIASLGSQVVVSLAIAVIWLGGRRERLAGLLHRRKVG